MNWLKKLFQSKSSDRVVSDKEIALSAQAVQQPTVITNVSGQNKFVGIDHGFVNLIYFNSEGEKTEFIKSIEKILSRLKITEGMDYVTVHKKLTDYSNKLNVDTVPLLTDALLFKSFVISKTETIGRIEISEKPAVFTGDSGEKIKPYYSALNFCRINLKRKIEGGFFDFGFEASLIDETLRKNDLFNYARIDTLFTLGSAYYKASDMNKMEDVFDRIRSEQYELGASIVANYYRSIGEIYANLDENEKALGWLKAGLALNPKLGVKKLVDRLEDKTER